MRLTSSLFSVEIPQYLTSAIQDPRKSRAMGDAKTRMNEMYDKLKTGQYSDELEGLLNELVTALQAQDKAAVTRVIIRRSSSILMSSVIKLHLHFRSTRSLPAPTGRTLAARS